MRDKFLPICFFSIIVGFSLAHEIGSDKNFSEYENKYLTKKPSVDIKKIISGQYSKDYESYYNDQFPLRNTFINGKAFCEDVLQKIENNNILYGRDGYLFSKMFTINTDRVNTNIKSINSFVENTGVKNSTIIIPSSQFINNEQLFPYTPILNDELIISSIYKELPGIKIDLIEEFMNTEDLYYKTDHHWNLKGAYKGYEAYCSKNEIEPVPFNENNEVFSGKFYGTHFSKSKKFNQMPDRLSYYNTSIESLEVGDKVYNNVYNEEALTRVDKYAGFIYGNNPLTIINSDKVKDNSKILVVKDSYANSLVPFLSNHFEEVHIIDLRFYSGSLKEYVSREKIKESIIIYSLFNFSEDTNLIKFKL